MTTTTRVPAFFTTGDMAAEVAIAIGPIKVLGLQSLSRQRRRSRSILSCPQAGRVSG